jgi:hypothetical protein
MNFPSLFDLVKYCGLCLKMLSVSFTGKMAMVASFGGAPVWSVSTFPEIVNESI